MFAAHAFAEVVFRTHLLRPTPLLLVCFLILFSLIASRESRTDKADSVASLWVRYHEQTCLLEPKFSCFGGAPASKSRKDHRSRSSSIRSMTIVCLTIAVAMPKLYTPRDAAKVLGIGYSSLKQWIYRGKLKTVRTPGGHHRIPESEIDRLLLASVCQVLPRSVAAASGASVDEISSSGASPTLKSAAWSPR